MYDKLLNLVNEGQAILTAGKLHPDIPTIHDVGNRDSQHLKTDSPVEHCGFGLFIAKVGEAEISFDGGGAMNREEDGAGTRYSWTLLRARAEQLEALNYDLEKVRAALSTLNINYKIRQTVFGGGLGL